MKLNNQFFPCKKAHYVKRLDKKKFKLCFLWSRHGAGTRTLGKSRTIVPNSILNFDQDQPCGEWRGQEDSQSSEGPPAGVLASYQGIGQN
jgi:hypothetical protein